MAKTKDNRILELYDALPPEFKAQIDNLFAKIEKEIANKKREAELIEKVANLAKEYQDVTVTLRIVNGEVSTGAAPRAKKIPTDDPNISRYHLRDFVDDSGNRGWKAIEKLADERERKLVKQAIAKDEVIGRNNHSFRQKTEVLATMLADQRREAVLKMYRPDFNE